ncbi:MAG: bifunctional precorrin-2 dehydrogenase/sirohydrochlorin ferrochelatase [Thermodesulfovibrionales bacterium]|nr:bifunctional precorrin-2 dehydrogenase/sirohydrochlorin ferrochelatase [Thermodesulfovibrionales bacterium]
MRLCHYYPAFINLLDKQCVVVGGGRVAERKVLSLLKSGARVKIISPVLTSALEKKKIEGKIKHIKRNYRNGDLKKAFLVIAATSDDRINRKVSADAPCLVNVVDQPSMANFIVPSVIKRGPLTVAISTSGASPAVARKMRIELESLYKEDFGRYLNFLSRMRKVAIKEVKDKKIRENFLKDAASEEIFHILRTDGFKKAKERVMSKMQETKCGVQND